MSDEIFRRFAQRTDVDLSFLMTNYKGEPEKYLESIGHPEIQIVRMPQLFRTTKYKTLIHKAYYGFLRLVMPFFYNDILRSFDLYFSPYPPISPIVYNSGIKTACICHDVIPLQFPHFAFVYKNENFSNYVKYLSADRIFFVSNSARRDFLTYRPDFPFEKTVVTYLGIGNITNFGVNPLVYKKYKIPREKYIFVLSESNPRKNFPHIIKSFVKYIEDCGDKRTNLVIGGKKLLQYDYSEGIEELLRQYEDRIIITGHISDDDLSTLYTNASLFLYPSLYEGFGLPPLEAMNYGVPVIVANNSSLPEVCGDAALYVSGFSVAETAATIEKILSDSLLSSILKEKGQKRAAMFSFDKMVEEIMTHLWKISNIS
ncbi:MAG: glycosyltransferase family 4 protein [Holosporaceae bacterium]|nr:glycosyltransferase family 4 protein [Holosporaceae bacterium]